MIVKDLGRYHILEQLGEGGMAVVYKAYDTRLETDVAVKVIRTENLPQSGVERALKRFEREAKALASLTHPNIVPIIDYGEYAGSPYLVMKYLPGGTLKQRLGHPLPYQEAAGILAPIARALEYAHQQGIVHRDVKPSNILITESGQPMLSDFGVAKILEAYETMDLTGTSMGVGTPEYMAPEQVTSKTADGRADIYSLGVVFFELVTGRKPFVADTPMAVLFKQASEPLPRPRQFAPGLPEAAEKVLFKALAKDPANRYGEMGEFASALEGLLKGSQRVQAHGSEFNTIASRRWKVWMPIVMVIALLAIGIPIGIQLISREKQVQVPFTTSASTLSTRQTEPDTSVLTLVKVAGIPALVQTKYPPFSQWIIQKDYTSNGPLVESNPDGGYTDNTLERDIPISDYFKLQVQFIEIKGQSNTILLYGQESQGNEWWQGMKRFETGLDSDTDAYINLFDGTRQDPIYINHFVKPKDGIWVILFEPQGKSFSVLNSAGEVIRYVVTTQFGFPDGIFPEGIKRITLSCGSSSEMKIGQLLLLEPAK